MTEHDTYREQSLQRAVSTTLTVSTIISLTLMVVGSALAMLQPQNLASQALSLANTWVGLIQGSPMAFFSLGVLVILASPAVRELVLLIGYAQRRRWLFAFLPLVVLAILALSVFLSLRQ